MRPTATPARAIAALCLLLGFSSPASAAPALLPVEGGQVSWEQCSPDKPSKIVLLHDGVLGAAGFDEIWAGLCRRHHVVRYDRRGYGASPKADGKYAPVGDVAAVMQAAGMTQAVLVGASAGGGVAVDFALARADAVRGLYLIGPSVEGARYSEHWSSRDGFFISRALLRDFTGLSKEPHLFGPKSDAARARFAAILKASPGNLTAGMSATPATPAAWSRLGELRTPFLVSVGEHDMPDLHAQAGALAALIPGARRTVIPGTGHYLYMEQPADTVKAINDFAERAATGG